MVSGYVISLIAQQTPSLPARDASVRARLVYVGSGPKTADFSSSLRDLPAVLWLVPIAPKQDDVLTSWKPHSGFSLVQKDRIFHPHLLIVPPGTTVTFPNQDPFFHNVFSLFEGKRFDLGLYETGTTRAVTFSRPGPSYIFCNIHPEMSAVVLVLPSPYFAVANARGEFKVRGLLPGHYEVHLWAEGVADAELEKLKREVHITSGPEDLGEFVLPGPKQRGAHTNLYGKQYDQAPPSSYLP